MSQEMSPCSVVDSSGSQLANWLIENKIIDHIFGPNLHVEVGKSRVCSEY